MKRLLSIVLFNFLFAVTAYSKNINNVSGEQVLTQMLSVYASCSSYSDEGNVEEIYSTKDRTWTDNRPFKTAFARPSLFYFEYQERFQNKGEWRKYMVWETKEGVHSWWTIQPQTQTFSSLALALAGPTGVSRLSAYNLPFLLREDVKRRGHRFQMTSTFNLIGEETVDGITAYKLEGKNRFPHRKDPSILSRFGLIRNGFCF